MTEMHASDNFRLDGLDRTDATPDNPGLAEKNARDLASGWSEDNPACGDCDQCISGNFGGCVWVRIRQHIPVEEGGDCTDHPCFKCHPIDGCTG